mmetsp:Transcript_17707/g.26520  ORF Transcript_17707/g.26520 Transcript_17707/m.26520 type:complete len:455 (+) Transcript_17707:47-1411(+)|eukprot:CAMPEP_0167752434 /NCGR_PEP_ID=MMETSP0110_2-20121227/7138_1 /TAXON_ID=629695 /ORGANISM="Gymnochlora sp., Strain CCMP2014" /LENGTH=454 /DNA_ID=CAMNT_0007638053 /DNA_START=20 /DNA_END=1384 /DNA_ORIENTATION=-
MKGMGALQTLKLGLLILALVTLILIDREGKEALKFLEIKENKCIERNSWSFKGYPQLDNINPGFQCYRLSKSSKSKALIVSIDSSKVGIFDAISSMLDSFFSVVNTADDHNYHIDYLINTRSFFQTIQYGEESNHKISFLLESWHWLLKCSSKNCTGSSLQGVKNHDVFKDVVFPKDDDDRKDRCICYDDLIHHNSKKGKISRDFSLLKRNIEFVKDGLRRFYNFPSSSKLDSNKDTLLFVLHPHLHKIHNEGELKDSLKKSVYKESYRRWNVEFADFSKLSMLEQVDKIMGARILMGIRGPYMTYAPFLQASKNPAVVEILDLDSEVYSQYDKFIKILDGRHFVFYHGSSSCMINPNDGNAAAGSTDLLNTSTSFKEPSAETLGDDCHQENTKLFVHNENGKLNIKIDVERLIREVVEVLRALDYIENAQYSEDAGRRIQKCYGMGIQPCHYE